MCEKPENKKITHSLQLTNNWGLKRNMKTRKQSMVLNWRITRDREEMCGKRENKGITNSLQFRNNGGL